MDDGSQRARPMPDDLSRQVIESLTSGVLVVDKDGVITLLNRAGYEHLGLDPARSEQGLRLEESFLPATFRDLVLDMRREGHSVSRYETVVHLPSGKRREVGVSSSSMDGVNGEMVFLFTDITSWKSIERSAEMNRQLAYIGEMTAGVVHQLRNPLSVIAGMAELLQRRLRPDDRDLQSDVAVILEEVVKLERLINQLLNFSRPFHLEVNHVTCQSLTERVLQFCRGRATAKAVDLNVVCPPGLPELHVDREMVAQALSNIVANAIDAAPERGEVTLRVYSESEAVVFEVLDNGPGVDLRAGENLFAPFFSRKKHGTGIGLAIAHRITDAHGGSIAFNNRPQGGARFALRLPLEPGGHV